MKKFAAMMVGLGLMLGTVSVFAQDPPAKKEGKKKGKKKKADEPKKEGPAF